jgi:hypothetical protein
MMKLVSHKSMFKTGYIAMFLLAIFAILTPLAAQEHNQHNQEEQNNAPHRHMISVQIGHTHLSEGARNGQTQWLIVPSWAIDYNYLLTERWIIGLHTDMIIENFEINSGRSSGGDLNTIERSRPISVVGVGVYEPIHRLGIIAGGGFEYAPEETFGLVRIGVEPSIEINHRWAIIFSVLYDIKIDAYNSFSLGFGVARLF